MSASNDIARPRSKKRRWLRWWAWVLIGLVVVAVGSGGFVWVEHARSVDLGETAPVDDIVLATSVVTISSSLPGYVPGRGTVTVIVDGDGLGSRASSSCTRTVWKPPSPWPTAVTRSSWNTASSNVFSRLLTRSWGFTVDTTSPAIKLVVPSCLLGSSRGEGSPTWRSEVDEPATLELRVDGEPAALDPADLSPGPFVADLALAGG